MHPFHRFTPWFAIFTLAFSLFLIAVGFANLATGFVGGSVRTVLFLGLGVWGFYGARSTWRLRKVPIAEEPRSFRDSLRWLVPIVLISVLAMGVISYLTLDDPVAAALLAGTVAFVSTAGVLLGWRIVKDWERPK